MKRLLLVPVLLLAAGCTSSGEDAPDRAAEEEKDTVSLEVAFAAPERPVLAVEGAGYPVPDPSPSPVSRVHVDVVVGEEEVVVPSGIGVDPSTGERAALYTLDTSGIVYTTTPPEDPATLGELMTAWGVPFEGPCVGMICAGGDVDLLIVYLDGKAVGDPVNLPLRDGSQIFVWLGPDDVVPPVVATYSFPS